MPKIAPGDLDIAIVGQLPAAHLPLGNQFEPRLMDIVGFQAPVGCRPLVMEPWRTRLRTRTMPSYSPMPMPIPNSTAAALEFDRASGGNRKNMLDPSCQGCSRNALPTGTQKARIYCTSATARPDSPRQSTRAGDTRLRVEVTRCMVVLTCRRSRARRLRPGSKLLIEYASG
jgi:hypothetical protein